MKFEATTVLVGLANGIIALDNLSSNIVCCRQYLMEFGRTPSLIKLAHDIIATENHVSIRDLISSADCAGNSNEANTNKEKNATDQDLTANLSQDVAEAVL